MLTHASLFSGIGGFDMAATWKGWYNIFSCEKDPFCRKILKFYWPQTEHYEDIYQFDATPYRGTINVLSGGFPCQPFSQAGRRKGKADDRYLWPETRRIITEVRPEWIVLENVAGLFTILEPESLSEMEVKAVELFCSDSEQEANATIIRLQRRVIGSIISEIGTAGYLLPQLEDGTPIVLCVPACAVNAPHRRDRTWFVAYSDKYRDQQTKQRGNGAEAIKTEEKENFSGMPGRTVVSDFFRPDPNSNRDGQYAVNSENEISPGEGREYAQHDPQQADRFATYTYGEGLEGPAGQRLPGNGKQPAWYGQIPGWDEWPTQSPVCGRNDGLPRQLDGIAFSKWRNASIKAYGNAIVPQVALEIFHTIEAVHQSL